MRAVRERTKIFLVGLLTTAVGFVPTLAAFDVLESDEEDFGAPRWFVAATGYLFVLVGAWLTITRAPERPVTALLRALTAPLLLTLCGLFCAAVVVWFRRVHAGPHTRALFLALAVVFALSAGGALRHAVAGLRRRPRA
jgi:cytochrome bd-type quinol oxidase subunit 2